MLVVVGVALFLMLEHFLLALYVDVHQLLLTRVEFLSECLEKLLAYNPLDLNETEDTALPDICILVVDDLCENLCH